MQLHADTPASFNFDCLSRHYHLRNSPNLGEIQVNLANKATRDRQSYAIALDLRNKLRVLSLPPGA